MSVAVSNLTTLFQTYIGDTSTNRISDAERRSYFDEATVWLLEELGNEHMVDTYELDYLDGVHRYKVTTAVADLLVGADLRRDTDLHTHSASRKSPREFWEEVGLNSKEFTWGIERYDGDSYFLVNLSPNNTRNVLSTFDSTTAGGGTWVVDSTGSDATNLTLDINEKKQGVGSLNFDIDVSQSANNKATIYNPSATSKDLSSLEDLGSFTFWVYVPDATDFTSITLYWGSDESATPSTKTNYWSATVTTDIDGSTVADGWNQFKIDWKNATQTLSPDSSAIVYYQFDVNYDVAQGDDTDYRIDDFNVTQPERLTFHYISWYLGKTNAGVDLTAFTAETDVPFFSVRYDQYKYPVAHKAASIAFYGTLRNVESGAVEEKLATESLQRYRKMFESSITRELKSFKVLGNNLRLRRKR